MQKCDVASKKNQKKVDIGFMIWYITNATEKEARNDLWKLSKKVKIWVLAIKLDLMIYFINLFYWEFDPGSGWTLAACLRHASRTRRPLEDWVLAQS